MNRVKKRKWDRWFLLRVCIVLVLAAVAAVIAFTMARSYNKQADAYAFRSLATQFEIATKAEVSACRRDRAFDGSSWTYDSAYAKGGTGTEFIWNIIDLVDCGEEILSFNAEFDSVVGTVSFIRVSSSSWSLLYIDSSRDTKGNGELYLGDPEYTGWAYKFWNSGGGYIKFTDTTE